MRTGTGGVVGGPGVLPLLPPPLLLPLLRAWGDPSSVDSAPPV